MSSDYYDILEVGRGATQEEIKKAFRKQALKHHPDRNKTPDAATRFKEVNQAYQVLSDPERKNVYDNYGAEGLRNGFGGQSSSGFEEFSGFGGFGDIFDAFFGGSTQRTGDRRRPGADLELRLSVTMSDVLTGVKRIAEIERKELCEACNGSGAEPQAGMSQCPSCRGSGQVRRAQRTMFGSFQQVAICSTCDGRGRVAVRECKPCHGHGRIRRRRKVPIPIPPGIEDGMTISLREAGDVGENGGRKGSLNILIMVEDQPGFVRKGADLLSFAEIDIAKTALGCEIEIKMLGGNTQTLKVPPFTQPGKVFKFNGAGFPFLNNASKRGHHIVTINVKVPTSLTPRQRELLTELDATFRSDTGSKKRRRRPEKESVFDRIKGKVKDNLQGTE